MNINLFYYGNAMTVDFVVIDFSRKLNEATKTSGKSRSNISK